MPSSTIFYSWLSDLPAERNRSLILECLEWAAAAIRADGSLKVEPVIDRDTAGVPGAPDITATIFEKIDACDVFVCDVSIVGRLPSGRFSPNPNVMLELGYALKARGWGRVLLVMNVASSGPTELPFDLRGKRVVTYSAGDGPGEISSGRHHLAGELLSALHLLYAGGADRVASEPIPAESDNKWMESHAERAFREFPRNLGLSKEAFATVSPKPRVHTHAELLDAADGSLVHTFGWPIGVMSRAADHMTPKPVNDGIVMRIPREEHSFDYWALRRDGVFYMLKSLYEQRNGESAALFFDTRVIRATEVCMYLSNLYGRLGVSEDSRVFLMLRYAGLTGTLLKASGSRPHFRARGPAAENSVSPQVTTTLAALRSNMVDVVKALTQPLFVLFDFFELDEASYKSIVESYQNGQIG